MINQHLQVAIAELQEFDGRPDAREVRKALAVKLVYQGYKYEENQTILDVSVGSITSWKKAYKEDGISELSPDVRSFFKNQILVLYIRKILIKYTSYIRYTLLKHLFKHKL